MVSCGHSSEYLGSMEGEELIGQLGYIRLSRRASHEGGISVANWPTGLFSYGLWNILSLARALQGVPGGKLNIL